MKLDRRTLIAGFAALPATRARSQTRQIIKLGILADMSGTYRDLGGPMIEPCVRQAITDSGVGARGIDVEVVVADHLNKVDVGMGIALEWIDRQGVDALVDISNSGIALALAPVIKEKDKVQLNTGAGTSDLTGKACTPNLVHWSFDSWESAHSTAVATVKLGGDTWFFITPDYNFGITAQRDTTVFVEGAGGKVLGSVRYPFPGTTDFSSFLIQAQSSGAKVLSPAASGQDLVNIIKQAGEFGLMRQGMKVAAPITYINDVHGIGLELASGLMLTETFYWDLNDRTRAFTKRVQPAFKDQKPNPEQAGAYSGVLHYLKAVASMGVAQAKASGRAAVATMKRIPTDDDAFGIGRVREDGQKLHPAYLFEVKTKAESKYPWDYYKLVATTPLEEAFRPMSEGGCPLVTKT
ncbi:MAG: ABC transporter substrate-binding protein [Rhodopila sp.]|nr:ABC transporter substrate-binding protein [Rhodopila sp.]